MKRLTFVLPRFKIRSKARRRVPSGLLSLAAVAQEIGNVEIKIIDAESMGWNARQVTNFLQADRPDVIGISICTPSFPSAMELISTLRDKVPDALIIAGGKHVTHCWQDISTACDEIDALVRGEGERVIETLTHALKEDTDQMTVLSLLAKLPNVWIKGQSSKPTLPSSFDLSQTPPWPFETLVQDLDFYLGDRMLIEFSRGCPGRCSYCLASRDRRSISYRSIPQVVDTMRFLYDKGFKTFFFTDDDFAASPHFLRLVLEGIIQSKLSIEFDANVRPDSLVRCAELAPLLRQAGCRCLWLGIESGSVPILESYRKGFNIDTCMRSMEVAFSSSEVVRTNWIIGAPNESIDTLQDSVNLSFRLRKIGPHVPHISFMIPYPGTPVCDQALELGLINKSSLEKMANSTHGNPVMPSKYLSIDQLRELFHEFHNLYFDQEFFQSSSPDVATEAQLVLNSANFSELNKSFKYLRRPL